MLTSVARRCALLVVACGCVVQASARGDESADLRFRVKAGTELKYVMKSVNALVRTMRDKKTGEEKTRSDRWTTEVHLTLRIDKHDAQVVEATITYERIRGEVEGANKRLAFDTGEPIADASRVTNVEALTRKMVGAPLTLRVAADGEITSVEGEEQFAPLPPSNEVFNSLTEEDALKRTFVELFSPGRGAPDSAAPDATWQEEETIDAAGGAIAIKRSCTYRLREIKRGQGVIDATQDVTLTTKPGYTGKAKDSRLSFGGRWNLAGGCLDDWHSAGEGEVDIEGPAGVISLRASDNATVRRVMEFPK